MTDLVGATKDHLGPVRIAALCSGLRGEDETFNGYACRKIR